jgi:DNA polymerase-3 subunit delta'
MDSSIIGHKKILDFFSKLIEAGNLSHAYCFVGQEKLGKRTVAKNISAKIFNVTVDKLKTQPDFVIVEQEINEKTGKTKKNIDVDQIRYLKSFLSQRSFLGGYKIALIDNAEKMNANSANGILKVLEEPKEKTALFLITKDENLLPKTIQSRCQMIYFYPVQKDLIKEFILKKDIDDTKAEEMLRLSLGLPGRVCDWIEDIDSYELYKKEALRFISLFNRPFYEKLNKVDDIFGDKTDHIVARDNLSKILDVWLVVLRGFIHSNNGLKENKGKIKIENEKLINISRMIKEAKFFLNANIHPRILVEQILLELP